MLTGNVLGIAALVFEESLGAVGQDRLDVITTVVLVVDFLHDEVVENELFLSRLHDPFCNIKL